MVGTMIAAGNGNINQRNIYEMLTVPSKYSWDHRIQPAPSYGLYLTCVEYSDNVLENCIQTIEGNKEDVLEDSEDGKDEKYLRD